MGEFGASDFVFTTGVARKFISTLSGGINLKSIIQKIDTKKSIGEAVDAGILYELPISGLKAAIEIQNLGPPLAIAGEEKHNLPLNIRTGVAFSNLEPSITGDIDIIFPNDNKPYGIVGAEYIFENILAIRVGYRTDSDRSGIDNLSFGLGMEESGNQDWLFDYAYKSYGEIGNTNCFSLGIRF